MTDNTGGRRADLVAAVLWVVLGTAVVAMAASMDRLERLGINPYTIPGLVPALLGSALVVFGVVLGIRAWRTPAPGETLAAQPARADTWGAPPAPGATLAAQPVRADTGEAPPAPMFPAGALRRMAVVGGLCFAFAAGALGRGIPFAATAGAFVFALSFAVDRMTPGRDGSVLPALARAAIVSGIVTALAIVLFGRLLLLRLP